MAVLMYMADVPVAWIVFMNKHISLCFLTCFVFCTTCWQTRKTHIQSGQ